MASGVGTRKGRSVKGSIWAGDSLTKPKGLGKKKGPTKRECGGNAWRNGKPLGKGRKGKGRIKPVNDLTASHA